MVLLLPLILIWHGERDLFLRGRRIFLLVKIVIVAVLCRTDSDKSGPAFRSCCGARYGEKYAACHFSTVIAFAAARWCC